MSAVLVLVCMGLRLRAGEVRVCVCVSKLRPTLGLAIEPDGMFDALCDCHGEVGGAQGWSAKRGVSCELREVL
jgi:hypothetical protein